MIVALGVLLIATPILGLLSWMAMDVGIKQVLLGLGFSLAISMPIITGVFLLEYAGVLQ
jgi:hypothetical protein